ncbi:amino acid permease [Cupriavidus sp. BIC8F]|uniref:amino acid permease n=1 Tax=Cupriavidus sp. BIC8F TaxID=3079014 RepID=UPI0029166D1A|nr:amino acid permease [Cupriavidus sp. BIC8F]
MTNIGGGTVRLEGALSERIPFTAYDAGWVVLCIGMAIGSGIVFMPLQMGIKGIWTSVAAILIAYPAVYFLSKLFIRSLSASGQCSNYTGIITEYLGKNWGILLSVVYFVNLTKSMFAYSATITHDAGSYLQVFGVTQQSLASTYWFPIAIITFLVAIASRGERLLFKVSGPLIIVKLSVVIFLGVSMIPYWNFGNIEFIRPQSAIRFIQDVTLSLPFAVFSIVYTQILNPMNVAFRKVESDPAIATYRALRAGRYAYMILVVSVLFFAFSFLFSITAEEARTAVAQNISALALAARVMPGSSVKVLSMVLNIVAIMSAFLGLYLGFSDALKGIVINVADRFMSRGTTFDRIFPAAMAMVSVVILSAWVIANVSSMALIQWTAPTFGIVSCLIPCYLVIRVPALKQFRSVSLWFVALTGILVIAAPLFKLFER